MSKYYKADDVIRKRAEDLADTSYWEYGNPKNVDEWIEVAEMEFVDLPTIEIADIDTREFVKKLHPTWDSGYAVGFNDGRRTERKFIEESKGIVHCKGCKYSEINLLDSNEEPQRWCKVGLAKAVNDNDYCSRGEK